LTGSEVSFCDHLGRFGELALSHLTPASLFVRLVLQVLSFHEHMLQLLVQGIINLTSILAKQNELFIVRKTCSWQMQWLDRSSAGQSKCTW